MVVKIQEKMPKWRSQSKLGQGRQVEPDQSQEQHQNPAGFDASQGEGRKRGAAGDAGMDMSGDSLQPTEPGVTVRRDVKSL